MVPLPALQAVVDIVLGVLLAASAFFVVRGLGAIIRKRWRASLAGLLGLGLFAIYWILLAAAARLFVPADLWTILDAGTKARILGENIASLMNHSVWGAPLGLLLGVVFVIRGWRGSP
ncbi:MAG: hypothetical protein RL033_5935 [Pseudomonadota bacterium]